MQMIQRWPPLNARFGEKKNTRHVWNIKAAATEIIFIRKK